MRRFVFVVSILLCGVCAGLAGTYSLFNRPWAAAIVNGSWEHNPMVGSAAANMYLRAGVARSGLLALSRDEAIYFQADTDADGKPLSADHSYRISGRELPGRWWSITVYGADYFLMPNEQDRYSLNSENIQKDADGRFSLSLSRQPQSGNWLPLGDAPKFDLLLRVYNPSPSLMQNLAAAPLPSIEKVSDHD